MGKLHEAVDEAADVRHEIHARDPLALPDDTIVVIHDEERANRRARNGKAAEHVGTVFGNQADVEAPLEIADPGDRQDPGMPGAHLAAECREVRDGAERSGIEARDARRETTMKDSDASSLRDSSSKTP